MSESRRDGVAILLLMAMVLVFTSCAAAPPFIWRLMDSALMVTAVDDDGRWFGSGFRVARDHVLTAGHVASGAKKMWVTDRDGDSHDGRCVAESDQTSCDLALIEVEGCNAPVMRIADVPPGLGDGVWTAGFPSGSGPFSAYGVVGAEDFEGFLEIGIPVEGGQSGSPVVNGDGLVVGLVVRGNNARMFAIKLGAIKEFLAQHLRSEQTYWQMELCLAPSLAR